MKTTLISEIPRSPTPTSGHFDFDNWSWNRHDPRSGSVTQGHRENWGKPMCTSFREECWTWGFCLCWISQALLISAGIHNNNSKDSSWGIPLLTQGEIIVLLHSFYLDFPFQAGGKLIVLQFFILMQTDPHRTPQITLISLPCIALFPSNWDPVDLQKFYWLRN